MDAFVRCMLELKREPHKPPPALLVSLEMLCCTAEMYDRHQLAVAAVARAAGLQAVADMVHDNVCLDADVRDTALEIALQRVYAALAHNGCAPWAQQAVECHLKMVDLGDEAGIGPVMTHDDLVRAAGGSDAGALAVAVRDYAAVRELCLETPKWMGRATGATHAVSAKNNDTVGKLCEGYPDTSARDLLRLNPALVQDGFGERGKKLREGTRVVVCGEGDGE